VLPNRLEDNIIQRGCICAACKLAYLTQHSKYLKLLTSDTVKLILFITTAQIMAAGPSCTVQEVPRLTETGSNGKT